MSRLVERPRFSAVVVTLDEEAHIRQCLEPLAWCDERIVVDMESRDRTRDLAQGLATTILIQPWIPHMEFARNRGIEAATGDWIIVVDADEVVPPLLAERLRAFVTAVTDAVGVWIPRMNHCFGRPVPHVGGFPDYQLRCFRRDAGRYPDRLHGVPDLAGRSVFLPIEDGAWLLHVRKDAGIGDLVRKWDVYAGKEARLHLQAGRPVPGPVAMLWTALGSFRARFITMRGYRDGVPGLVLSVLFAFYQFEIAAKTWEAAGAPPDGDRAVGRLRSVPRLAWALLVEGGRRLGGRLRGRRPPAAPSR